MKIKVRLSDAGLRDAERQIQEYKTTLNKKARALAFRLSWLGLEVAKVRFANAEYSGSNDVKCHINQKDKTCTIVAEGKSVIMISSELPEVLGMSDRVYVMNEGKMVAELDAAEATQELIMSKIVSSGAN